MTNNTNQLQLGSDFILTELYNPDDYEITSPFIVKVKKTTLGIAEHLKTPVRKENTLSIIQFDFLKYYLMDSVISYDPFGKVAGNYLVKSHSLTLNSDVGISEFCGMPIYTSILGVPISTIIPSLVNYFTKTSFTPVAGTTYGCAFPMVKSSRLREDIWPNLCKIKLNQINSTTDLFLDGELVLPIPINSSNVQILLHKSFTLNNSANSISISSPLMNKLYCAIKLGAQIPDSLLVESKSGNWIDVQSNKRVEYLYNINNVVAPNIFEYLPINPANLLPDLPTPESLGLQPVQIEGALNLTNHISSYINRILDLRTLGIIVACWILWFVLFRK